MRVASVRVASARAASVQVASAQAASARLAGVAAGWLPLGNTLPRAVVIARQRWIVALLWLHVPALLALAVLAGRGVRHGLLDVVPVTLLAGLASRGRRGRLRERVWATLGLLTCSAVGVHLSGGLTEAHFHFFVVVAVISLYQDWVVFLLAIVFVAVHHAVLSVVVPDSVFDHPAAQEHPLRWATVHAAFVLAAAGAHVVAWRTSEHNLHDSLTGLPMSGLLLRQLERALARDGAAVVYLDLDGFKQVNDRLGHLAGNDLLAAAGRRMQEAVRDVDCLGRLGGDEFAVVLPGGDASTAEQVAGRVVARMAEPFLLPAGTARVGVSAGVAVAGRGADPVHLLALADAAMYEAKQAGKGRVAHAA